MAAVLFTAVVVSLGSSGALPSDVEVVLDNAAQLVAGVSASVACLWGSRRRHGPERAWRTWMGLGMSAWCVGQALWTYYQVVADTALPSPSPADVGYLALPVFAVPALCALAAEPTRAATGARMTDRAGLAVGPPGIHPEGRGVPPWGAPAGPTRGSAAGAAWQQTEQAGAVRPAAGEARQQAGGARWAVGEVPRSAGEPGSAAGDAREQAGGARWAVGEARAGVVFVLDGLVVVGSLFVLTWATALGAVVDAAAPTTAAFVVAVAYPLTDLVLVVMVVLLEVMRRAPYHLRSELRLLGSGLVALSVSDSIFAFVVSHGLDEMPTVTNAGFILGPLLIAVAALDTSRGSTPHARRHTARSIERAHLILPYVLVAFTGSVVAAQGVVVGVGIDAVEAAVAWAVLLVVLVRQMITLIENTSLLARVSATQEALAHRAHHDPLTGLANRALFGARLDQAVGEHRDHGSHLALLVIDLDDFKAVNDAHGHAAGDLLLQAVGGRLRGCVRADDMVARLGGDEFAVVLSAPRQDPVAVAERVVGALSAPFQLEGREAVVGASVGVVEARPGEACPSPEVLLQRADAAMYAGKRRGKGTAVAYGATAPDGPRLPDGLPRWSGPA